MPTYTTLPILILIAFLWRWTRGNTLAVIAFTAIFNAASVLNFGELGVAPWLLALAVCLTIRFLREGIHFKVRPGANRTALNLILLFLAYAALSGFVMPFVFTGITVKRALIDVPLSWGMANVAQLCYLAAAATVFLLTITSKREELEVALVWYVRGCITAAFIAIYQLANAITHIPYPDLVLYSNPGHAIFHAYQIGGVWRLNSTFTEASDMAGSLIGGMGILGWQMMTQPLRLSRCLYFILLLMCIVMSQSTTGYLCLAVMVFVGGVLYAGNVYRRGGMDPRKVVAALVVLLAISVVFTASERAREMAYKMVYSVVLNKQSSESYKARTESHGDALDTLRESDYVGAGWGSMRASGLGYTLLAAVGIPGTFLFGAAFVSLFLPLIRKWSMRRSVGLESDLLERALFGGTLLLCGMVLAGSEPIAPMLWMLFGIAIIAQTGAQVPAEIYPGESAMRAPMPAMNNYYLHASRK